MRDEVAFADELETVCAIHSTNFILFSSRSNFACVRCVFGHMYSMISVAATTSYIT